MTTHVDAAALAASLRRLQDRPAGHGLQNSLQQVVDACVQLFSVTGSGLMVADAEGALRYAVATDGPSRELEKIQFEAGEGLIEQHEATPGPCGGSGENDALCLASGEHGRMPVRKILDSKPLKQVFDVPVAISALSSVPGEIPHPVL